MTATEFLKVRNPKDKWHSEDAYQYTVADLNPTITVLYSGKERGRGYQYAVPVRNQPGFVILEKDRVIGVLVGSTMFAEHGWRLKDIKNLPRPMDERGWNTVGDYLDKIQTLKAVKYPSEYIPRISNVAAHNRNDYPHLIGTYSIAGERLQLRAKKPPERNKKTNLALLNPQNEIVGVAQNEYGATLIAVPLEYRRRGIARLLATVWYELNPKSTSGGFTPKGAENALRVWADRVREFLSWGWYSELLRAGRISKARVEEILSGLRGINRKPTVLPKAPPKKPKRDILVYVDYPTFVVYDRRFLEDQDERWIHGFGFFRSSEHVGSFLYQIDYDRPYGKLCTTIALQMARDEKTPVYVGPGYGDLLELDNIPHLEREGDYVSLALDILDLFGLARKERLARRPRDRYGEILILLLEQAHSKWR